MEKSPKKRSKVKGSSSKKKKRAPKSEDSPVESTSSDNTDIVVPATETTPAKTPESAAQRTTPSQAEECRMLEWLYYYRFRDSDQCVVWGSPQGSPTLRSDSKGKRLNTSAPWSPTSDCIPEQRKPPRRLINASELHDVPDFMSELTALSERVRAQEELSKKSSTRDSSSCEGSSKPDEEENDLVINISEESDVTDTQKIKEYCGPPTVPCLELVNQITDESFSALFDDDDDLMNECMLKCTQEIEERLQRELDSGNVITVGKFLSPRRSVENSPRARKCDTPKSGKKRLLTPRATPSSMYQKPQGLSVTKVSSEKESQLSTKKVPKVESKFCVQPLRRKPVYCVKGRILGASPKREARNKTSQKTVSSTKTKTSSSSSTTKNDLQTEFADDSFEAVLQSFMDEDVDLLSQALSEPHCSKMTSLNKPPQLLQNNKKQSPPAQKIKRPFIHKNTMPIHRLGSEEYQTANDVSSHSKPAVLSKQNGIVIHNVHNNRPIVELTKIPCQQSNKPTEENVVENVLEDEPFFGQQGFLDLLDSAESSSFSSSPPLQCTPEEIEKKKQEAKLKLEKKRMTTLTGLNKAPINQWNRQSHKRMK